MRHIAPRLASKDDSLAAAQPPLKDALVDGFARASEALDGQALSVPVVHHVPSRGIVSALRGYILGFLGWP